jgi:hypothetical protein
VLALREDFHQSLRLQLVEVHARGGRRYFGEHRQLRTRSRAAIIQAVQHARPRRLANGGGNF